jgi:phage tail-like protein
MRKDPLPVFCFHVSVPGYGEDTFFKSVSGLRYETEIVPVKEGGQNLTTYQLPGGLKWSNIVLKQGFTKDSKLLNWRIEWTQRNFGPRVAVTITQLNTALEPCAVWTAVRAWPVKWEISEFDASKNEVAIETLELAHEGIEYKTNFGGDLE